MSEQQEHALQDATDAELEQEQQPENEQEQEEGEQQPQKQDDTDSQIEDVEQYEEEAKALGWSPQAEWRGDKKYWVDAKTFIERGRTILPVVNERNRKLTEKVSSYEKQLKEQQDAIDNFSKFTAKQIEKMREQELQSIKKQQREALDDDNEELYDKLEKQKDKVYEEYKAPEAPKRQSEAEIAKQAAVAKFQAENSWYGSDPVLTNMAQTICESLFKKGYSFEDQLTETKKQIVEYFPQKFRNNERDLPPKVSKSKPPSEPVQKGAKWADLTDSEKTLAEGQMKAFGWTREQFLKEYNES